MLAPQVRRIIKMLELFSLGRKLTTSELCTVFKNEVSLRTIQRDLQAIQQAGIHLIGEKTGKRESAWHFPREYQKIILPAIAGSETTSLYMLKSYLADFKGTKIGTVCGKFIAEIEKIVPGDLFLQFEPPGDVLWQQDHGFNEERRQDLILTRMVNKILEKKWLTITYLVFDEEKPRTDDFYPQRLFTWRGLFYLAGSLLSNTEPVSIALNCIQAVYEAEKQDYQTTDFDSEKFRKLRFGVFSGKIQKVILNVSPAYADYFGERYWHPSQKTTRQADNSLSIEMKVPLSGELISWIFSWSGAVVVKQPRSLIRQLMQKSEDILEQYKSEKTLFTEQRYSLYKPGLNFP